MHRPALDVLVNPYECMYGRKMAYLATSDGLRKGRSMERTIAIIAANNYHGIEFFNFERVTQIAQS